MPPACLAQSRHLFRGMDLHADLSQRVVMDTGALAWSPSPMAGVERRMLDRALCPRQFLRAALPWRRRGDPGPGRHVLR
jgi:hypothetical protein